jgi:hypothetical protein
MAELVGEHADLTAVVGLVGDPVAEHLGTGISVGCAPSYIGTG